MFSSILALRVQFITERLTNNPRDEKDAGNWSLQSKPSEPSRFAYKNTKLSCFVKHFSYLAAQLVNFTLAGLPLFFTCLTKRTFICIKQFTKYVLA